MSAKGGGVFIRVLTAMVALPAVLALTWVPGLGLYFSLFVALMAGVGLFEYYAIVRAREISPETIGGIIAGTLVALSGYLHSPAFTNLALYGGILLVSALHVVRGQHSVAGLASSAFGVFYVGWFGSHVTLMHGTPEIGPGLVTILFAAVILTDSAAFFTGSLIGKHKLAPKVSPNKTWEGAVGGFAFALIGMLVLYFLRAKFDWAVLPEWPLYNYLLAGALLSITSQIGDLAESCLKRDAGVKDSGIVFPGHGGVLDRCDGLLFAAPVLYYIAAN